MEGDPMEEGSGPVPEQAAEPQAEGGPAAEPQPEQGPWNMPLGQAGQPMAAEAPAAQAPPRPLEVVFPHGGQQHSVGPLRSAENVALVGDMLKISHSPGCHFQLARAALEAVQGAGVPGILRQLRQCVASQASEARQTGLSRPLLYCAALLGHTAVMHLILALLGPEAARQPSEDWQTPLFAAAQTKTAVNAMTNYGRPIMHAAASGGDPKVAHLLLGAAPALVATAAPSGYTALHDAARLWRRDALRLLLAAAPQTALSADLHGRMPIHLAAEKGFAEGVVLLSRAALASATALDDRGNTTQQLALAKQRLGAARCLLHFRPLSSVAAALQAAGPGARLLYEDLRLLSLSLLPD
ncbi:hypothetical protein ABPG75_000440 [Micractinium tetrahymenae]